MGGTRAGCWVRTSKRAGGRRAAAGRTLLLEDGLAVLGEEQRSHMAQLVEVAARAVEDAVKEIDKGQVKADVVLVRGLVQRENLEQCR